MRGKEKDNYLNHASTLRILYNVKQEHLRMRTMYFIAKASAFTLRNY